MQAWPRPFRPARESVELLSYVLYDQTAYRKPESLVHDFRLPGGSSAPPAWTLAPCTTEPLASLVPQLPACALFPFSTDWVTVS